MQSYLAGTVGFIKPVYLASRVLKPDAVLPMTVLEGVTLRFALYHITDNTTYQWEVRRVGSLSC